jgi:lipopolysaccharide export system protein LptC
VKIRINNMLPLLIVLILALLTLWLRQAAERLPDDTRPTNDKEPDAIVQNLSIVRLGSGGQAQYSMSATRMLQFLRDNSTVLETPRFERNDDDGTKTTITANRGRITSGGQEAFFYGNVLLNRSSSPKQAALQARTEFLHILPDKDLVRTDRPVTITSGNSTLSGTGMEINKSKGLISLQSQVKGSYHVARK